MSETDAVVLLRQENERVKRAKVMLMETVRQIRKTINRLIDRYVVNQDGEKIRRQTE